MQTYRNDKKQELAYIRGLIAEANGLDGEASDYFGYARGNLSWYYDGRLGNDSWLSLLEKQNIDYEIDKSKDELEVALGEKAKRDRAERIRREAEKKIYETEKERYYKDKACLSLENCDVLYRRLMNKIPNPDCDIIIDLLMLMAKMKEKEPDKILCLSYDLLKRVVEGMSDKNRNEIIIALLRLAHDEMKIDIIDLVKLVAERETPHGVFNEMLEDLTPKPKQSLWGRIFV
jgi:hypothetical protein